MEVHTGTPQSLLRLGLWLVRVRVEEAVQLFRTRSASAEINHYSSFAQVILVIRSGAGLGLRVKVMFSSVRSGARKIQEFGVRVNVRPRSSKCAPLPLTPGIEWTHSMQ